MHIFKIRAINWVQAWCLLKNQSLYMHISSSEAGMLPFSFPFPTTSV